MPRRQGFHPQTWISGLVLLGGIALAARYERRAPRIPGEAEDHPFGEKRSSDEPLVRQRLRALQSRRGRAAATPTEIPQRGWKDIFWRTYAQVWEDRLLAVAAGVAFFGLLAMFPAITAFVSLYGLFAKATSISDHLSFI